MEPNKLKIDFEGIIKRFDKPFGTIDCVRMQKEALRQALPLILEHVAENIECLDKWMIDKKSITGQKDEILKLLGINN